MSAHHSSANRDQHIDVIRGLAILAVVVLHLLALLPGRILFSLNWSWLTISIDQVLRFCVPIFIATSGYALAAKYEQQPFQSESFWRRRLTQIVPQYLLWSAGLILIGQAINSWPTLPNWPYGLWETGKILLYGQADYHLYFIPLLLQLYVVFWFKEVTKLSWKWWLALAAGLQILTFWFFTQPIAVEWWPRLATDQGQYWFFGSWVWYLALGAWFGHMHKTKTGAFLSQKILSLLLVATGALISMWAYWHFRHGIDPIIALRFTRWPVVVYATLWTVYSLRKAGTVTQKPGSAIVASRQFLNWCGRHSMVIYFAHTTVLRIVIGIGRSTATLSDLAIWTVGLVVLLWLTNVISTWSFKAKKTAH